MITWLKSLGLATIVFLTPIHTLMICVGILIGADFITGLIRAIKNKEKITSAKMKRTILKCVIYQLAVISGFAMESIIPGVLPIAKLVAGAIGLVEFKSIAENVSSTTGVSLVEILKKISDQNSSK